MKTKQQKEDARMAQPFRISSVNREDVEQALLDALHPPKKARRMALAMTDAHMRRLASQIINDACESGAYWEACKIAGEEANK